MSSSNPTIPVEQALRPLTVGVDVGGQSIKIGLVDDAGRPLAFNRIPTDSRKGPENAVARLKVAIHQVFEQTGVVLTDVVRIGLATPGTMDVPRGMVLDPPNMPGWQNVPIRDLVADAMGIPVSFVNDANAAAFGESWVGSGRNFNSMVFLTLGTGVGGGIVVGDTLVEGAHSHGSECGHILLEFGPEARVCGCGQPGHLEAYASATALTKRAEEAALASPECVLAKRRLSGEMLTPLLIAQEAERGDSLAMHLVMETARYLGIGVVSLMHAIDPEGVVLGGAMTFGGHQSELGRKFLERVREEVRLRAFPVLAASTIVDYAQLGGDAGIIGAAGIARRDWRHAQGAVESAEL